MAITRDVTVNIVNDKATLDGRLYFYEKDYGIQVNFVIKKCKFKYDKNPDGFLSSIDDDILQAYTTIINPIGEELTRQNGLIINDTIQFQLTEDLTDELIEIGIYNLQFHIVCEHSEISIPPIKFEVKERLKGRIGEIIPAIIGVGVIGNSYINKE